MKRPRLKGRFSPVELASAVAEATGVKADEEGNLDVVRSVWHCRDLEALGDPDYEKETDTVEPESIDEVNLIGSQIYEDDSNGDAMHAITIDLDVPARLVPSSTEGHSHLYIDVPISWDEYDRILRALADAGIVEQGYAKAAITRKQTYLRPPWVKK